MKFCRRLARKLFFESKKADKRHIKELRKGSLHNLLTSSLQKILLSAAGITMLTQPLFAASKSTITALGSQTKIDYNDAKKTHTITTTLTKGNNAFNAFKKFTLSSNEIANLQLPNNTKNLINFVKDKIEIQGTLNAVKNSKIGGNLYFLSSEGLILGKGGVINAGAFYAMTPTKDFMDKFIPTDNKLNLDGVNNEIDYIVDRKISDYNAANKYGVNINPLGEIIIEGKINTINGIGLYAGGTDKDDTNKKGLVVKNTAVLNTFAKEQLSSFVNLDGISLPEADEIITTEGNIELVSVQNNTHHTSSISKYATGYSKFGAASASARIEMDGTLNSRNKANVTAYALNGNVKWITDDGKRTYTSTSKISDVNSTVIVGGTIKGKNGVSVKALSDSDIELDKMNLTSLLLEIGGQVLSPFPLNIDANVIVSDTNSNVDIKKTAILESDKAVSVNSTTKSISIAGAATSLIVLEKAQASDFSWLPEVGAAVVITDASSKIDFDGKAISNLNTNDKDGTKAISIKSQSDNTLESSATAASMDSQSTFDLAVSVGKFNNKATLNIGENASFNTPQMVELAAIANNKNNISSKASIGNTAYVAPSLALSFFDSEATGNYEADINLTNQVGSFTFNVANNILSDKLSANTGISPLSPIEEKYHRIVKKTLEGVYSKIGLNTVLGEHLPDANLAKFSIAGAVAYGGGVHTSTLNIKPGAKLVTTGDLILKSSLNVEDTKYGATSKAKAKVENQNGAKSETALSVLISNYDYKSNIILDDSLTNNKTKISGKSVVAESKVYQPYQRPQKMVEELIKAWEKLKSYFTKAEHQEVINKISAAFNKLGDTDAKIDDYGFINSTKAIFTDLIDGFNSLWEFAKLEGFVLSKDAVVPRLFTLVYDVLAFKEYSNYLNNSVSSSVLSKKGEDTVDFSGSVFVGKNSAKSNIFIGKNAVINSVDATKANTGITIKSTSDVTNTTMVGGLPVLYANNAGTKSIGGAVIAHMNSSEANVLAASGATIGNNNLSKVNIDTVNVFTPIDIVVGTTSTQTGFNAMASAIDGDSFSNIRIDEGTNLSADTIKLNAYNNTNADNIVGALTLTEKVGIGVGLGITLLDKETQVLVEDNDEYWQKKRKEIGLRSSEPKSSEYVHEVATITADIFNAVAKTTGTINTIGVAGSLAIDDKSKYDKFSTDVNKYNSYASKGYLEKSTIKYKLIAKIMGINIQDQNVPNDQQQQQNQQQAQQQAQANPQNDASLSLTVNGSAASNSVENTTKVSIDQANFNFKGNTNRKFETRAINSAHTLAFAGAAGIIAKGGNANGTSVGVDGTVAVNEINNTTETKISNTTINEASQVNALAINGGESIATGLGLQVIAKSGNPDKTGSGAVNASVNVIDNEVTSKIDNVTSKTSGSNKTNMAVTAYESDTQVTGGVSAAVGKQKGAVGVSIDIAKIDNTLTSEISNSNLSNMKNVEVNALQASTIVNAGIAAAVAAGTQNSGVFTGAGVYTELGNISSANLKNSTIIGENVSIRAQDVRTNEDGVKAYEDNLERNGKDVSFIDKDGKEFYTGLDTATGTTELGELASSRKGSLLVTAAISGAYGGTAVGLGAAINEIDNTFNVNVDKSNVTATNKFEADAISNTNAITVGIGASISTEANKGAGVGSAAWNQIKNQANVIFSDNTIKSGTLNLKSSNKASLVGVGGQFSASKGYAAVGASLAYNDIDNTASSKLYGGSVTGVATNTSKLSVNSENTGNIWGVSVSVEASNKVAVGGTVVINKIDNNATSEIGDSSKSTKIASLNEMNILATDSADIKGLSGAITASKKVSIGGAVTVNHINGTTAANLNKANFFANNSNIRSYSESNNLSLATGLGGSGVFAFDGAAVNNDIFRDVKTTISDSTTNNTNATFNSSATAVGNTGSLAAVVLGAGKVAIGAGVSVNRMGGDVKTSLQKNNLKVKDLSANSYSNQEITTIGVAGSGAGVSLSGSVAYNSIAYNTISEAINNTLLSAENNISIRAVSDDILKNYSGMLNLGIGIPEPPAGDADAGAGGLDNANANPNPVADGAADNRGRFRKLFDGYSSSLKSGSDKMGSISNKMGGVGVGVSVAVNKVDGKTNATLSGGKVEALGKDSNNKVTLNNIIDNSDINQKYVDSSTISINSSLAGKRKTETKTGLIVDASSTHTAKSFIASVSGSGKASVNANVNVNYIGGETNATFDNATLNQGKNGKTSGDVSVKATDYTNTAGFIGNVSFGGKAGIGASADTNKVHRDINAKVSGIKSGSVAKNLDVKAISKQGISSVVAGLAASLQVGVAGNIDVALLNSTTKALIENSKISVNSLDVEANHYARSHEMAIAVGIGAGTAGVGAAVVVNNDINTVSAGISSSTIDINSGNGGAVKVNAINDDDFETITGAGGAGIYAGVAGAVAVDYMENAVETNVASTTIGTSSNRADSIVIKAKDISKQVSEGGSVGIGGYAGVGAIVEVNTLDGQTNTKITNSNIYANKNIDLGSYEERNSEQFAVSVSAGLAGVGANVLVINSGKKLDLSDSGSSDANTDTTKALGMADEAVSTDYKFNDSNTFSDSELKTIFGGKPTYVAAKDGKAVTLTKIDKSIIDSKSGKISSNNVATGSLYLSNNGGAGGAGAVLGCFGYVYDNKNVVTSVTNSHLNAGNGIDIYSRTGGKSELSLVDAVAGIGDYAGAFGNVKMAGNTSVGIAGSRLINTKNSINIISVDEASGKADSRGYTFGGVGIGTIIARAKNDSLSDVTISNSRVANNGNYTASNTINISSEKNNSLNAIGYSGNVSGVNVSVVSTLAQDEGKSTLKLGSGNYFVSNELNALSSNRPDLYSKFYSWSGGVALGVGVGDITTREYGTAKLNAVKGSNYKVNTVNMGAVMDSESTETSEAYTVTVGADIHANRADTLSSSNVEVDVNIGKDDFDNNTILNVYGENNASATIDTYGVSAAGILSVANNLSKAVASLTTNVNVVGEGKSTLSQINAYSSSGAVHKLHANGDGGGAISISPYAASTESIVTLNTNTNLSKDLSADKITAEAMGTAKGYLTSDAIQGELFGGCGTGALYDYNVNSNVNVKDNAKLTAKNIDLKAQNNFTTGSERSNKNNKTRNYGVITGARIDSDQKIKSNSQVKIGKKANLLASEKINLDAKTKADLFNKVQVYGAGLGSHLGSHATNDYTFNNYIITDEGSLLKTDEKEADINIAASYNINGDFSAYSEVQGAGAGNTSSEVINNITNNNNIDISGDIYSYNDINLYTDQDTKGIASKYYLNNEAESYTKAVIPWSTDAIIDNNLKRNNTININSKSNLNSVRHTTLSADKGDIKIKNYTKEYNWYKSDTDGKTQDVSTVAEGESKGGLTETDKIKVDGKVTAGIHNNIEVKIDGKVAFDTNITGDGIVRNPTITCNTDEYKNAFKTGTMDYGNALFERYQQIIALCQEYSGTVVGLNYEAEKVRIENEMVKYGLYDPSTKQVIGKLSVEYIELPDMISSGGNIYVKAKDKDSVSGSGMLKAKGAPKIQVENNSNLYMKVNDLSVIEPGGDIVFNNLSLGKNAQSTLSKVKTVETDASEGSLIEVKENWKGNLDLKYKNPDDGKTYTLTHSPLTNIEINGHIVDEYGNVAFYNASKDIVLQGKTAKDSASINGASISISAPNGSIAQGYTQGITNIGYTPEAVLKDYAKEQESSIISGVDLTKNDTKSKQNTLSESDIQTYVDKYKKSPEGINDSESGVWLAGGSVFLNGDVININGTIQSGYSKYEVTLSDSDKAKIKSIQDNYNSSGKPEITQAYLEQNCRINESGMKWDSTTGTYKYVVQAYYNPQTDTIILEDITTQGGRIYLTGRISNTGGGKIYAADGSSDININNTTGYKLTAKTLDVGDRNGFISIMDLAKNKDDKNNDILATLTEMTSDSTKIWYVTKDGKSENPDKTSGSSSTYNPLTGLTYNWTTGYDVTTEYRYDESYKFTVWGLIDYGEKTSNTMMQKIKEGSLSPSSSGGKDKKTGDYIGAPQIATDDGYSLYFQNIVGYTDGPHSDGYTHYNSWVHFSGTHYSWSTYKQGSSRVYQHAIKADYPISIGFMKGNGDINLTTNSDLQLDSDVISKYGNVKLTSTNGYIEQTGGKIFTDNIWLNATTGIGSQKAINQKMQSDSGVLSAITNSGDINLISDNFGGIKDSNLKLTATTNNGNTNVVTDASLLQGETDLDVKGSRIDLVSNYGSIGTKDALLRINAGQTMTKPGVTLSASVNAQAVGDVALNQTNGDMRIGKIVSNAGDVYLTSAGSVLDALPPSGAEKENQSVEQLIAKWKEMGIISESGKDNSAEKRQEAITVYKNSVYSSYSRYTDLKERYKTDKDTSSETYKEYLELKEKFGNYSSADKWLEAQNKDKNSNWYKLQNDVTFGWTQEALLYAIQDSIINREEGSTVTPTSPDDANIKARNVVINAGGGIGRDEGYTVVDISNLQSKEGIETLKAIAAAEASDVKWGYDGDKVDKNKATINKVNSLSIDAKGTLEANAKGNIYFEDVNNNAINLVSVTSTDGNVRVYGNNGIYNATVYKEGADNNTINLSGKDLIIEAGNGSIGSSTVPLTTDMSGVVTVRSTGLINLYQLGVNSLVFSAAYSGANINIRALNNILSIYNGVQAEELGYINAKGDLTLISDNGDIGQSNGKGLRIKVTKDKVVNAEANNIYLKGYGDSLNLGKITARNGNVGIEAKAIDILLKNVITAKNLEFIVKSIKQIAGSLNVNNLLNIVSDNGVSLTMQNNKVAQVSIVNNKSGDVIFNNNRNLTINKAINESEDGNIRFINKGAVTAKNGLSSNGDLFIWSNGNIDIQNDSTAKKWIGLYADNGGIKTKSLSAESIDFLADNNGLSAENITSNDYIKADVEKGNINIGNITAKKGKIRLITHDGNISSNLIKAGDDVNVVAYNGTLNAKSIQSSNGSIEAVGYDALSVNNINAANDFYVGSLGDVNITNLYSGLIFGEIISDLFDSFDIKDKTSYLIGKDINIEKINVVNYLEALSNGKLTVNNIIIGNAAKLSAKGDISIDKAYSKEDFYLNSFENGNIKVDELKTDKGDLSISNEIGDIELEKVNAGGDVHIRNNEAGSIFINDSITTKNNGSLYANINNGYFSINSGEIDGEASIYSEKGFILLNQINIKDELDTRAKDGFVTVVNDTKIGGDATLKSDTESVVLANIEVGGNLKLSAKKQSFTKDANVGGSMLMKGLDDGCYANNLNVGNNLIINTDTGEISVENAIVGEDTYISIDGNGKNIDIKEIKTGKDLNGDLIVVSKSEDSQTKIDIKNAVAANKLILNSLSNINLKSAYALNGRLEVKGTNDVVAELIQSAKNTYIGTIYGLMNIIRLISGDSIEIINFAGKSINIDHIETLNPEADINIAGMATNLSITNASTTRDIDFFTINGNVYIDNVYAGNNIKIDSLIKNDIDINNSAVGNDIIIKGKQGDINIYNTSVGNDLKAQLTGTINISDVNVTNNTEVTLSNNSIANIDKLKSNGFDFKDNGKSNLNIANSLINNANVELKGSLDLSKSNITNFDLNNSGNSLIKDSTINTIVATNNGKFELTATPVDSLELTNNDRALIHDSYIKAMTVSNDGEFNLNNLTSNKVDLTSAGNTNIDDSNIDNLIANNSGNVSINNLVSRLTSFVNSGNNILTNSSIDKFDLNNTGSSNIVNNKIAEFNVDNTQELTISSLTSGKLELNNDGEINISDSRIKNIEAQIGGKATITNVESSNLAFDISGETNISESSFGYFELDNSGKTNIKNIEVNNLKASNKGKLEVYTMTGEKLELNNDNDGEINISDSRIKNIEAQIGGKATISNVESSNLAFDISGNTDISDSKFGYFELDNSGKTNIENVELSNLKVSNKGKLEVYNMTGEKLDLSSSGNTDIKNTNIATVNADDSGSLIVSNLTSEKADLTISGNAKIEDTNITRVDANISGDATISNIESNYLSSVISGNANIENSTITKIDLSNSGNTNIIKDEFNKFIANNTGSLSVKEVNADNLDVSSSGKANFEQIELKGNSYIANNKGNMSITALTANNNLDMLNTGNTTIGNIHVFEDFNFALGSSAQTNFDEIVVENKDLNLFAGKATLNGRSLLIGNDLNVYGFDEYSKPNISIRAAIKPQSQNRAANSSDDGFTLKLDETYILGGLNVDNPDITIDVNKAYLGDSANIRGGNTNIKFGLIDVESGNLNIMGNNGSIKIGEAKVAEQTSIRLGEGNLDVTNLKSNGIINFNIGGNITSDGTVQSETDNVNILAGGNINAYKVLAAQQGNIEAVNGDIVIGQINGKTLVFKEDTNDRTLRIGEANVESKVTASADNIDIDLINQTDNTDRLGIDFALVNGRAMDNVVIRDVQSDKGVNMFNLVSMYGNIHVSNEFFDLTQTYLLRNGDLSNTKLKFRLFGHNPVYSSEPNIIAFFNPSINHKDFANISFNNVWHPERQDYYPLISKNDYRLMFNQYTVVQDFEALRLAYEDSVQGLNNASYKLFDFRKLDNSKSFYVEPLFADNDKSNDNVNIDNIEVPVGLEFDSAKGELKSVGNYLKPQPAID